MNFQSKFNLIFPCLFLSLLPFVSFADQFHYVNLLVGDRATGMGGAYTAVSDDSSGLYYNPAGVVYSGKASLSGSMNTLNNRKTTYQGVIAGEDWERNSSSLIPGFFGVVQPVGSAVFGFSYAVSDSTQADQDQEFGGYTVMYDNKLTKINRYRINYNETDIIHNFGPSIAFAVNNRFSLGLTLYGHYRSFHLIQNTLVEQDRTWEEENPVKFPGDDNNMIDIINIYNETDEYGVKPVFGLMVGVSEKVAFGAALSKTYVLNTVGRYQKLTKRRLAEEQEFTIDDNPSYPLTLACGLAYFPNESFLISSDVAYNWAYSDIHLSQKRQREATWNAALGAEWFFSKSWGVRAGIFTDRANTSDLEETGSGQEPHIDLLGGSLSLSRHSRASSLTVGTTFLSGSGEAQIQANSEPQDAKIFSSTYYISASYRY